MDIKEMFKSAFRELKGEEDAAAGRHNSDGKGGNLDAVEVREFQPLQPPQPHPVLSAALTTGIDTPEKFSALVTAAKHGAAYATETADMFAKAAVRRFGPTDGPAKVAKYAHLDIADKRSYAAEWDAESDEKFGIGKDGTTGGAERMTAASAVRESLQADGAEPSGKKWDRLSASQQAHGIAMGYTSDEQKEAYAANVLELKGAQ